MFRQKTVQTFHFHLMLNTCSSRSEFDYFTFDALNFILTLCLSLTPFFIIHLFPSSVVKYEQCMNKYIQKLKRVNKISILKTKYRQNQQQNQTKQCLVHKVPSGVAILSHVSTSRRSSTLMYVVIILVNVGRQGILCLLAVKKWNGSRHLVFWSLGTLTGLRDRVRRLIA
jgi:hypothetical protein